ncbi:MAG: hypothetical protein ACLRT4_04395 [Thomasclavelia sp.]
MEVFLSCICSIVISIAIGNLVIYHLEKIYKDLQRVFDEATKCVLEEIENSKKLGE